MKAKKAIRRLNRVETLLGAVIDQFDAATPEVRDLLDAARTSVTSAAQVLSTAPARKPPAKAEHTQASRISGAVRKRLSIAAKKRWADAKRNGMSSLAKPARKTA